MPSFERLKDRRRGARPRPHARRRDGARLAAVLLVVALSAAACSSGNSDKTPEKTTSTTKSETATFNHKLKRERTDADVKNVIVKVGGGDKISLSSPAPGHDIVAQQYNAKAAKQLQKKAKKGKKAKKLGWSKPTTVYSSDTSYCSAITMAAAGGTVAATLTCSSLKTERTNANASVLLASDDLKTWKDEPLPGASGTPTVSPSGKYASFNGPDGFVIWSSTTGFAELDVKQTASEPAVGAVNDDGTLIMVRSKDPSSCVIWLLTATPSDPTPQGVFTSRKIPDRPNCTPLDAKLTKKDLRIHLESVITKTKKKKKHKKTRTKDFTAFFTQGAHGGWAIE